MNRPSVARWARIAVLTAAVAVFVVCGLVWLCTV
jgi:hypothetical protein